MNETTVHQKTVPGPMDDRRLFPLIDRWFVTVLALELVAFALVPLLPLGVAAAGLATPLRRSRWRLSVLFGIGFILSLIVAAPFILALIDIQLVQNGQTHTLPGG